jgi:hypothetical protein
MALLVAGDESADIGNGCIVAEYLGDGIDECALAVGAGAVGEDEFMLGGHPSAAVAHVSLEEALKLGVAVGDAFEEDCP